MIFNCSKVFRNRKAHDFMKRHNIPNPTDHALVLAGFFIQMGHEVELEYKVDRLHVDLYVPTWSEKTVFELISNNRTKEQLECDKCRDTFLSNEYDVLRVNNKSVEDLDDQMTKWMAGFRSFQEKIEKMIWEEEQQSEEENQEATVYMIDPFSIGESPYTEDDFDSFELI